MKNVLITDVDNTLLDWVEVWYQSFSAMLKETARILDVPADSLLPSIQKVHQRYGTSEYAFLLEELPEVQERFKHNALEHMEPAIDAYRKARRATLRLYPNVIETMKTLKSKGITIVAYTESQDFYTQYRFRKLGLDQLVDYLYSPKDTKPTSKDTSRIRIYESNTYNMVHTIQRHTPFGEIKPNPDILISIVRDLGKNKEQCVYIGDSKMKDIAMAQEAGITDVWAKYGQNKNAQQYELLKKVTHWTPEMVEREKKINFGTIITPSHTLELGFEQIIEMF
ncbi:HAD family hydrolase [Martelella lutilitoris]|uniref:phosphoglycolate phosphatase n=1 Tax=Martelella lutilitoris TaxID=2583532 RepID=A0A5C4JPC9_9HYPH|nr:HAD-IA family hydrolase [Martelella lutilitoris]TNB47316.1 HAD family hydrolase [Martelella lutilitoris]